MSNDQLTINTLRELNSRLASEITELRKENSEIPELRKKFSEVEAENNELKVENVKLKQALEEHESRFAKLEQNDNDTIVENAELKARVAKLEQKQSQNDEEKSNFIVKSDDDTKGINQSSVNTTFTKMKNSNDISASNISDNTSNSDVAPERIENSSDNTPDSDPYQEKDSRSFTSPIPIGTLSSEEKEINEFLELQEKERVSNREKKICRGQQLVRKTSSSSDTQNAISTEINPIIDHKTTRLESIPTDQAQNTGIKIPYNKRVEQVLRHDLSVFIKENINNKVSEVFDIQIPEFSLEVIITGSSKITAQSIADLFIIAMKVRQKEILCWYCYYKAYEDRIEDIKRINKIDDQSARTLVYNEIKALLPNISDVNLRQRTFRAKKIYTLLMGIGIEKIQAITCSASAISSLTDNQIQDIINCFSKNSNVDDSSVKYQEMIGVTNCNAHVTEPSSSKDVSNIEVRIPTESSHTSNSEDMISEDKSLLETKASASSNLIRDHTYFRNKILEQYSNLYREGSDGNDDYYGITDESLCPLCKLDHNEENGIEGRYKIGSYYIKCEQRGIEIEVTA